MIGVVYWGSSVIDGSEIKLVKIMNMTHSGKGATGNRGLSYTQRQSSDLGSMGDDIINSLA